MTDIIEPDTSSKIRFLCPFCHSRLETVQALGSGSICTVYKALQYSLEREIVEVSGIDFMKIPIIFKEGD